MARKQEQESAREEVVEVAPDVLRMQLPIRLPGLGHVNCYAIMDQDGAAVVDPGLPGPLTWKALQQRLGQAGLAPKHIHTVIVTHSHPDHFGCASRFTRASKANIVAHHSFSFGPATPRPEEPEVSVDDLSAAAEAEEAESSERAQDKANSAPTQQPGWQPVGKRSRGPTPWGGRHPSISWRGRMMWYFEKWISRTPIVPTISTPVEHGHVLRLAGREWFVIHTPGHTGDHICLHDPENEVFLSGDHVLPTITPHIAGLSSSPDPLSSYLYSLDRVAEISHAETILPAHGHPFTNLAKRTEEIKQHHQERLGRLQSIARELGPASVQAFSKKLFRPRSWGAMAESETYAHLEHMRLAGDAERYWEQDELLYRLG